MRRTYYAFLCGFCVAVAITKLSNGEDATFSIVGALCWLGCLVLTQTDGRTR